MTDARELLFAAAERLNNANPESLDSELLLAKGIGGLVEVIVNSAKVEVSYMKATGERGGSGFLELSAALAEGETPVPAPRLVAGAGGERKRLS